MTTTVGVIGCGMVSHAYLGTIVRAPELVLKALASRTMVSAAAQASRYGGDAVTIDALLRDPDIEIVVNLAPPSAHHSLGRRILAAGKHLYSEKPFATQLDHAHHGRVGGGLGGCAGSREGRSYRGVGRGLFRFCPNKPTSMGGNLRPPPFTEGSHR